MTDASRRMQGVLRAAVAAALRRPRHAQAAALCSGLASSLALREPSWLLLALVGAAAVLAGSLDGGERLAATLAAIVLAGAWWGSVRLEALDATVLAGRTGEAERAVVAITGPVRRGTFSLRAPAEVRRWGPRVVREAVLLELPLGRAPPQGAVIRLVARVRQPRPPSGRFDEGRWLRLQGRQAVLRGGRWQLVGRRGGVPGLGDRLHERVGRTIERGLGGEREAVVAGVVLGEDEGLDDGLRDAFRASGLYHLLAVSGQNVAFIAAGVLFFAWIAGIPRLAAQVGALLAILAYVLAVGWQPSVVRAGVAGSLACLAWLAARPADRWYFALCGAAVLLAWNPYSLLEPGFQLSFAAVGAIFVAVPRMRALLDGYPVPRSLADVAAVSTACGLATAPVLWLHFGAVPTYTLPANALAAPVVAPLLGLGLAAAAVEPVAPSAAAAIVWLDGWLAAYLAGCARLVAALPFAQVQSGTVLAALGVAAVGSVAVARLRRRARRRALALAAVALLLAVGWRSVPATAPPPEGLRVTFLDVGQGDAVLVQAPGAAVLVDQGPPEGRAAEQLRRLGVRRLSLLVLTHPQRDHIGGAADVLRGVRVDTVLDPRLVAASPDWREATAEARRRGVPVLVARAGDAYRLGRLSLRVLWPDGPGLRSEDPNEHAVVLLASYGEADVLLTADAESHVTARLRAPPVEVLKVAHHGSADPLLPELLRAVRPRLAVVSVGEGNDYGHPAPSTLAALEAAGVRVLRTDLDGRVTVESDGRRLEVRAERG